jgi:hypothetical protein
MKVTQARLKEIIKEELDDLSEARMNHKKWADFHYGEPIQMYMYSNPDDYGNAPYFIVDESGERFGDGNTPSEALKAFIKGKQIKQ